MKAESATFFPQSVFDASFAFSLDGAAELHILTGKDISVRNSCPTNVGARQKKERGTLLSNTLCIRKYARDICRPFLKWIFQPLDSSFARASSVNGQECECTDASDAADTSDASERRGWLSGGIGRSQPITRTICVLVELISHIWLISTRIESYHDHKSVSVSVVGRIRSLKSLPFLFRAFPLSLFLRLGIHIPT